MDLKQLSSLTVYSHTVNLRNTVSARRAASFFFYQETKRKTVKCLNRLLLSFLIGWLNEYINQITFFSSEWHKQEDLTMFSFSETEGRQVGKEKLVACSCVFMIQHETKQQTALSLWSQLPGKRGHSGNWVLCLCRLIIVGLSNEL